MQAKSAELSEARQKIAELSEAQIKHMNEMAATLSKMDERESELNVCRQPLSGKPGFVHHCDVVAIKISGATFFCLKLQN